MKARYIAAIGAVCMMVSCAEDKIEIKPTPGGEVRFSAGIGTTQTRTLYGVDDGAIKVKWVDSDLIQVYGADCANKQAEYKVVAQTAETNTPHSDDGQNYADRLDKTGESGVQWGETASDFYAIYPSADDTQFTENNGTVSVNTSIRSQQNNVFEMDTDGNWIGTPYISDRSKPAMPDAIMYAYAPDIPNGSDVDLNFKPFTTVLKFYVQGWEAAGADFSTLESIQVQSITVKAPYAIAGDFSLALGETVTATPESTASDEITVYTMNELGSYLTLAKTTTVEFSVFTIPVADRSLDDWTVTLKTVQNGTFTLKLKPAEGKVANLTAGMVHRVKFPKLPINEGTSLDPTKWIAQIPRNVYLSELSIPGAWYATDGNYQAQTDLAQQYEKGIRGFNIDCRASLTAGLTNRANDLSFDDLYLACSGTESSYAVLGVGYIKEGTKVKDKLIELLDLVKAHPDEYIVAVLSIAEKPYTESSRALGSVNPSYVLQLLNTIYDELRETYGNYLYTEQITANTTVGDVLGHLIIKVNANTVYDKFTGSTYTVPSTLLSEASMCSNSNYLTGDIVYGTFSKMQERPMCWGKTASDLTYYYHQAQLTLNDQTNNTTSGTPSFKDRMDAIDDIIAQSKTIYDKNLHNAWFQMGIGGYIDNGGEDRATVASVMNPYLKTAIDKKIATDPSPVGIVLMNYATTTGADLVTTIINMNERFHLNRDETKEPWPDPDTKALPASNGAYAYVGEDAF